MKSNKKPGKEKLKPKPPALELKSQPAPVANPPVHAALARSRKTKERKRLSQKRPAAKARDLKIPAILLEGDASPKVKAKGPGTRYALAPAAPALVIASALSPGELPEAYGTGRLFLTARDPRWLYASWDFTSGQQQYYNAQSRDSHLILRVFTGDEPAPAILEVHVNPESRNWFLHVPRAGTRYRAELGYYTPAGHWQAVTPPASTFTPPDAPGEPAPALEFATIPLEVTFQQVVEAVQEFAVEHTPLLDAVIAAQDVRRVEEAEPPRRAVAPIEVSPLLAKPVEPTVPPRDAVSLARASAPPKARPPQAAKAEAARRPELLIRVEKTAPWPPERVAALARLVHMDRSRRVWMGSIEITELVRRQLAGEVSSIAAAELAKQAALQSGPAPVEFGISSRAEAARPRERRFWFKVNAELVLYGATEPDAQVTIAGRVVQLRPDGTFSFRFALPDGRYHLPAEARSADGAETRQARLEFTRATEYRGRVEPHPQDPGLKTPRPENIG